MSPSYKQQVSELLTALATSNAEVQVLKTREKNTREALCTVYRGVSAMWAGLRKQETLSELQEIDAPGFLTTTDLPVGNVEIMTDHILIALGHMLRASGKASLLLKDLQVELDKSQEILQTHKDGLESHQPIDLRSPLNHLTNALTWLDEEDQKLRVQIRVSQEAQLEHYRKMSGYVDELGEPNGDITLVDALGSADTPEDGQPDPSHDSEDDHELDKDEHRVLPKEDKHKVKKTAQSKHSAPKKALKGASKQAHKGK
jgi:hypothetical protein